jgi:16S rRNA C967 or C1407 C5-methylase (RsmB/RsmF family)
MPRRRGARKRKKTKTPNGGSLPNSKSNPHKKQRADSWTPWVTENKLFEEYYVKQPFMKEGDFVPFLAALREELPTTIRVNEAGQFCDLVKGKFAEFAENLKGVSYKPSPEAASEVMVDPPHPVPWFPANGRLNSGEASTYSAWQFSLPRRFLNQKEATLEFRNFLIMHHALGTVSRQEVVSMIPPLFMDVQPHHSILDMCAAPGSKTTQLIEHLHQMGSTGNTVPTGFVIANDAEPQRCHTLATQLKRTGSPCILVTNHRAQFFPLLYTSGIIEDEKGIPAPQQLLFDRILCDVPCGGDGTMRKNPDIWVKWNPLQCISLHRIQSQILWRAFEILKVGGRIVYSTCSLNPIEDEAVIAGVLVKANGALRLVDVGDQLPELKRRSGITSWRVMDKSGQWYDKHEQLPEHLKKFPESVFPPEKIDQLNIERCFRILPHDQNTGGFFVAVLEKTAHTSRYRRPTLSTQQNPEGDSTKSTTDTKQESETDHMDTENPPPSEKKVETETEIDAEQEPEENEDNIEGEEQDQESISSKKKKQKKALSNPEQFFPLPSDVLFGMYTLPFDNLLARISTSKDGLPQKISYFPTCIKNLTSNPYNHKLKILNSGIKVFQRMGVGSEYRICQEGLTVLLPFITKRIISVTKEDIKLLLKQNDLSDNLLQEATRNSLKTIDVGPCIYMYKDNQSTVTCAGSRGRHSLHIYLRNNEKNLILQALFPEDFIQPLKDQQPTKKSETNTDEQNPNNEQTTKSQTNTENEQNPPNPEKPTITTTQTNPNPDDKIVTEQQNIK